MDTLLSFCSSIIKNTRKYAVHKTLREEGISVATYGKCTNWKEKKEHLHLKIFPFKRNIGQPYTVDSTFEKKEIGEI